MKIKITLLLLMVFTCLYHVKGQQFALSSQYYLNDIIINPATAGVKDYLPISMNIRRQWMGVKEAPVVQSFSTSGYVGLNLGCGGYIINEVTGPTRRTGINFSTAYHRLLDKMSNIPPRVLSFGLAVSFTQHYFNINKLNTYEEEDLAGYNNLNYKIIPDANFGVYYSRDNDFYAGLSIHHLLQTRRDLYEVVTPFNNGYKRTYYLTGGYNVALKERVWEMQPSAMFQMIEALPFQLEVHDRLMYKKMYWMSAGYRLKDAIILGWGLQYNIIRFSYSYDISLSPIRRYTSGSHEINFSVIIKQYNAGTVKKKWYKVRDRVDF